MKEKVKCVTFERIMVCKITCSFEIKRIFALILKCTNILILSTVEE